MIDLDCRGSTILISKWFFCITVLLIKIRAYDVRCGAHQAFVHTVHMLTTQTESKKTTCRHCWDSSDSGGRVVTTTSVPAVTSGTSVTGVTLSHCHRCCVTVAAVTTVPWSPQSPRYHCLHCHCHCCDNPTVTTATLSPLSPLGSFSPISCHFMLDYGIASLSEVLAWWYSFVLCFVTGFWWPRKSRRRLNACHLARFASFAHNVSRGCLVRSLKQTNKQITVTSVHCRYHRCYHYRHRCHHCCHRGHTITTAPPSLSQLSPLSLVKIFFVHLSTILFLLTALVVDMKKIQTNGRVSSCTSGIYTIIPTPCFCFIWALWLQAEINTFSHCRQTNGSSSGTVTADKQIRPISLKRKNGNKLSLYFLIYWWKSILGQTSPFLEAVERRSISSLTQFDPFLRG
jgi:hypothetical protein